MMNKFKKLTSVVLAGTMTLALSANTFAAIPGLSEAEQRLLDAAKKIAAEKGVDKLPEYAEYLAQAEAILAGEDVSLTSEEVDKLIDSFDDLKATAKEILNENNVDSLEKLKEVAPEAYEDLVSTVVKQATDEANTIEGVTAVLNDDGTVSVKVTLKGDADQNGQVDLRDVQKVLQVYLDLDTFEDEEARKAADTNQDGDIDLTDAQDILNIYLSI